MVNWYCIIQKCYNAELGWSARIVNEKQLSEMTLEELWALFLVILKEHNPQYSEWYEMERRLKDDI